MRQYIAIDLKSFYASAECAERGLDPLTTNLVVADESRTEKTICLAVSPSLKAWGVPGRPRLFEVQQIIRRVNARRRKEAPQGRLIGSSYSDAEIRSNPAVAVDYIVARPQMARYMALSARVFEIYSKYVSPEDIHVYSVDEVFMDVTDYLQPRGMTAHEMAMTMIRDVLSQTRVTATAGIGTNLYLAKIAMDIVAKRMPADSDGVRVAELDEMTYRHLMWTHRPLTDFWRVGKGTARRLEGNGMMTMGDVARCSLVNEDLLYRLFGVNAELLIDHAWGWESCTIADIKAFRPASNSLSSGQVLAEPYPFDKARLIAREMADGLVLDMVDRRVVTDRVTLVVVYDVENLNDPARRKEYRGQVTTDFYGRDMPKPAHGAADLGGFTSSGRRIIEAMGELFDRIVDRNLLVRRVFVGAEHITSEAEAERAAAAVPVQLDMFTDLEAEKAREESEKAGRERERARQQAVLAIRKKYGGSAILRGMDLQEGATARERNAQIGGHRA